MNAVQFPQMLKTNKTSLLTGKSATYQNLKYLLLSEKQTLLGDPYFGSRLKSLIYEKKNIIIRDLIIDEIYTCINTYMPQLYIQRKDITLSASRNTVYVTIRAKNMIDYNFEDYTIQLLTAEELQ